MSHTELIAVEKFAKELKDLEFPVIENPTCFRDEILNAASKHAHRRIDTALERAKDDFDKEALGMAKEYGN